MFGLLALLVLIALTPWCCCDESTPALAAGFHGVSGVEAAPGLITSVDDQAPTVDVPTEHLVDGSRLRAVVIGLPGQDCTDPAVGAGAMAETGSARALIRRWDTGVSGHAADLGAASTSTVAGFEAVRETVGRPVPATAPPYALCVLRT